MSDPKFKLGDVVRYLKGGEQGPVIEVGRFAGAHAYRIHDTETEEEDGWYYEDELEAISTPPA